MLFHTSVAYILTHYVTYTIFAPIGIRIDIHKYWNSLISMIVAYAFSQFITELTQSCLDHG